MNHVAPVSKQDVTVRCSNRHTVLSQLVKARRVTKRPRSTCSVCGMPRTGRWHGDVLIVADHRAQGHPCLGSGRPGLGEAIAAPVVAPQRWFFEEPVWRGRIAADG